MDDLTGVCGDEQNESTESSAGFAQLCPLPLHLKSGAGIKRNDAGHVSEHRDTAPDY